MTRRRRTSILAAAMIYRVSLTTVLLALLLALPAAAEPFELAPAEGVLVLRSGGVLTGKIARVGDRYYVTLEDAEIRVKVTDVEHFCRTLDEAYSRRRAAIGEGRAAEHLDLAEWCLQQKLYGYAARELIAAQAVEPRNPRIVLVTRRLELLTNPPKHPVATISANTDRAGGDALDTMIAGLPAGTVEQFTSTVQPLLMNGCSAAACHGPASTNRLQLERIQAGRPLSRRITHRNLKATLGCVDRDNPSASTLLTRPLEAHGTLSKPVFAEHDIEKYQQLVNWVNLVASKSTGATPANVTETSAPLLQTIDKSQSSTVNTPWPTVPSQATDGGETLASDSSFAPNTETTPSAEAPERGPQRGATLPDPEPEDPFDPEIFNRQFGKSKE